MRARAEPKSGGLPTFGIWLALAVCGAVSQLNVVFSSDDDVAVSAAPFDATGHSIDITLSFTPATGTPLTVENQTGVRFIEGALTNLAHGQLLDLEHGGKTYRYVANYYVGEARTSSSSGRPTARSHGDSMTPDSSANGSTPFATLATAVDTSGVLSGKTVLAVAAGKKHSLALCSDGTLATWSANKNGQLGNNRSTASSPVPVRVVQAAVLAARPWPPSQQPRFSSRPLSGYLMSYFAIHDALRGRCGNRESG